MVLSLTHVFKALKYGSQEKNIVTPENINCAPEPVCQSTVASQLTFLFMENE